MNDLMSALEAIVLPAICADDADWQRVIDAARTRVAGHGDLPRWESALSGLPDLNARHLEIGSGVAAEGSVGAADLETLRARLRELHPWSDRDYTRARANIDRYVRPPVDVYARALADGNADNRSDANGPSPHGDPTAYAHAHTKRDTELDARSTPARSSFLF